MFKRTVLLTRSRTICDLRVTFTLLELAFLLPISQLKTFHRKYKSSEEPQLISNYFCSKTTKISWRSCNGDTSQNPFSRQDSHWIFSPKIHHSLTSKSMEMISHGNQMSIMHDNRSQPEGLWLEKQKFTSQTQYKSCGTPERNMNTRII